MLTIERLNGKAIKPKRSNPSDSGLDLFSTEDVTLYPKIPTLVGTGWKMAVPEGYEIQIRPRSGNALKKGITILNTPGTIDSSYRGEVKVILFNTTKESIIIKEGDKIAQAVIAPVILWNPKVVKNLDNTARGEGGFGSTGE